MEPVALIVLDHEIVKLALFLQPFGQVARRFNGNSEIVFTMSQIREELTRLRMGEGPVSLRNEPPYEPLAW